MPFTLANCVKPALERACSMVICGRRAIAPGWFTSPATKIRWLFIAVTTTVTRGSAMYFFSFSLIDALSCIGVMPAACTSSSKGREILPSGRTGRVALISGSSRPRCAGYRRRRRRNLAAPPDRPDEFLPSRVSPAAGRHCCPHSGPTLRWSPGPAEPGTPPSSLSSCALLCELGSSVFRTSHLFQLVQQRLITDLQFFGGPAPVPSGACQFPQNDFLLRFARCGARRLLQRNLAAVAP